MGRYLGRRLLSPIAFRSWDDICQPKDNGGLGIRDLHTVNKSLIIHAAWNIAVNKNPFLTSILRAKYFHNNSFWTANSTGPRSVFWSSILQVRKELFDDTIYQIRAGSTSIWSAPWCLVWDSIHDHLLLPVTTTPMPSIISDLWIPNTQQWDMHLLSHTFDNHAINAITSINPIPNNQQDILIWFPSKNGTCSTKNICMHLSAQRLI